MKGPVLPHPWFLVLGHSSPLCLKGYLSGPSCPTGRCTRGLCSSVWSVRRLMRLQRPPSRHATTRHAATVPLSVFPTSNPSFPSVPCATLLPPVPLASPATSPYPSTFISGQGVRGPDGKGPARSLWHCTALHSPLSTHRCPTPNFVEAGWAPRSDEELGFRFSVARQLCPQTVPPSHLDT